MHTTTTVHSLHRAEAVHVPHPIEQRLFIAHHKQLIERIYKEDNSYSWSAVAGQESFEVPFLVECNHGRLYGMHSEDAEPPGWACSVINTALLRCAQSLAYICMYVYKYNSEDDCSNTI